MSIRIFVKGRAVDSKGNEQEVDIELLVDYLSGNGDMVTADVTTDTGHGIGRVEFVQKPPFQAFPYRDWDGLKP